MKKLRGFRVGRKLAGAFKWILIRTTRKPTPFHSLGGLTRCVNFSSSISKILGLGRRYLQRGPKTIYCSNSGLDYIQLSKEKPVEVPKGHLALYVNESDGEIRRVVVPVIYFNHPLFGELLKKAERVYGYNHPGGITIPCGYSEFEEVKMKIAARDNCYRRSKDLQRMCWH